MSRTGLDPYDRFRDSSTTSVVAPPERAEVIKALSVVLAHCDPDEARMIAEMIIDDRLRGGADDDQS